MKKLQVKVQRDHIESLSAVSPISALEELIWNGFDAFSNKVQIFLDRNNLGGLDTIRIRDFGNGINHTEVESLFGNLGDSWKKAKKRQNGRSLHGKNGKGRFRSFALGEIVEWNTAYRANTGKILSYNILGQSSSIADFNVSDPIEKDGIETGTEVTISNVHRSSDVLLNGSFRLELAKKYALHLTEYPDLTLEYDGLKVDPNSVQCSHQDYLLGDIEIEDKRMVKVELSIVEWNIKTDRHLFLCNENGMALQELTIVPQIRAPGYNFTAFVKSRLFEEMYDDNLLELGEANPDVRYILGFTREKIKEHFRRRLAESQSTIVERWKEELIYPYEENFDLGPIETAERQVFDILAVNVEHYLPAFEKADYKSKKFTFRLLAQAIKNNPDSIQQIIVEVLGLKKAEQDDLAELLKKTSLTSIISSAKIVANRLNFLVGLENLLSDEATKKIFLERDQLHKMLENEAWLFHEEFTLAGSEQRLEEVLQKHLDKLGDRNDDNSPVKLPDGKTGRVDLMLHKVVQPRTGEYDYLIVELKRPSKKIDAGVLSQIESYAIAVASDERFHGVETRWTFIAISNNLDDFTKKKAKQRGLPKGRTYDDADLKITVWVKEWSEVINDARSKLLFVNKHLAYEANRESAKTYLDKVHSQFLPTVEEITKTEEEKELKRKTKSKIR